MPINGRGGTWYAACAAQDGRVCVQLKGSWLVGHALVIVTDHGNQVAQEEGNRYILSSPQPCRCTCTNAERHAWKKRVTAVAAAAGESKCTHRGSSTMRPAGSQSRETRPANCFLCVLLTCRSWGSRPSGQPGRSRAQLGSHHRGTCGGRRRACAMGCTGRQSMQAAEHVDSRARGSGGRQLQLPASPDCMAGRHLKPHTQVSLWQGSRSWWKGSRSCSCIPSRAALALQRTSRAAISSLVEGQQLAQLHLHQLHQLLVLHHVNLVEEAHNGGHANLRSHGSSEKPQ